MWLVWIVLALPVLLAGWMVYGAQARRQRRETLQSTEMSAAQRALIARHVPLVRRLPLSLRDRLEGKMQVFLDQVEFIGCDGLVVTEEMRLAIAAQACLLVVNTQAWYDDLTTILIYPGAFRSRQQRYQGYVVNEADIVRSGESWTRGPVVLSWEDAAAGAANDRDGHNVVFHEFAHQLDDLTGRTDGVPLMGDGQDPALWTQVMEAAFERHADRVAEGRPMDIDPYGAEGPEEFFAVVVEMFLESPVALRNAEPEVYDQLAQVMQLDPVGWG